MFHKHFFVLLIISYNINNNIPDQNYISFFILSPSVDIREHNELILSVERNDCLGQIAAEQHRLAARLISKPPFSKGGWLPYNPASSRNDIVINLCLPRFYSLS